MPHLIDKASHSIRKQPPNVLRELLKQATMPDIISLAGGFPAPESFPTTIIQDCVRKIMKTKGTKILQYGVTDGLAELKNALLVLKKNDLGNTITFESIQVTTGSQQALDLLGRAFINRGDKIAVEQPTYLGALQAFNFYKPAYFNLESDGEGPTAESVEEALRGGVKYMYLVTDFANPSGSTISLKRRKLIAELAKKHDGLIIEDSPYRDLRYKGEHIPPLYQFAPHNVIYLGSFSKILAPGLRLGYAIGNPDLIRLLTIAKQGADLFTSGFDQAIATEYVTSGALKNHIPKIVALYRPRLDAMLSSLEDFFPEDSSWTHPEGGMFVWVTLPKKIDASELLKKTLLRKVAFVPGKPFFPPSVPTKVGLNTMRLNFTNTSPEIIRKAVKIIAEEMQ
jgi:2-aminoadipate transaminase